MQRPNRRGFLGYAAALPLGSAAVALRPQTAQAESPTGAGMTPNPYMAKPDYTLAVAEQERSPFGTAIKTKLANGQWPGTEIRYRTGDTFRVVVQNDLKEPTSIHWHGLILPNLQDGVPEVTQAPIQPRGLMLYEFPLVQAGTYWYHSHFGLQEQQGLSGPLIIEDPNEDRSYDHDVTIFLADVLGQSPESVVRGLQAGKIDLKIDDPYLLPGQDRFAVDIPYDGYILNGQTNADPWSYSAHKGERLRLRIINGSASSFFRFKIDGLPLTVIASDGEDIEPVTVDSLMIGTAERYDVLVTLPDSGSYTIHAAALGDDKQVVGVLHTKDSAAAPNRDRAKFSDKVLRLEQLVARQDTDYPGAVARTIENNLGGNMQAYLWEINGVRYPEIFAGEGAENIPFEVGYGELVRFKIINKTPMYHPMHLHGHVYRVLNGAGKRAPLKDTVAVAPKSTVTLEFLADNPGKWFWHCHNLYHLATGMAREVHYVTP